MPTFVAPGIQRQYDRGQMVGEICLVDMRETVKAPSPRSLLLLIAAPEVKHHVEVDFASVSTGLIECHPRVGTAQVRHQQ
jgi:hypothetical protein